MGGGDGDLVGVRRDVVGGVACGVAGGAVDERLAALLDSLAAERARFGLDGELVEPVVTLVGPAAVAAVDANSGGAVPVDLGVAAREVADSVRPSLRRSRRHPTDVRWWTARRRDHSAGRPARSRGADRYGELPGLGRAGAGGIEQAERAAQRRGPRRFGVEQASPGRGRVGGRVAVRQPARDVRGDRSEVEESTSCESRDSAKSSTSARRAASRRSRRRPFSGSGSPSSRSTTSARVSRSSVSASRHAVPRAASTSIVPPAV